jgi:zinc protease
MTKSNDKDRARRHRNTNVNGNGTGSGNGNMKANGNGTGSGNGNTNANGNGTGSGNGNMKATGNVTVKGIRNGDSLAALRRRPLPLAMLMLFLVVNFIGQTAALAAESAADSSNENTNVKIKIKKPLIPVSKDFTLANGLRVVLSEDHSVPVVALALVYDVGARDEVKGKSGFAHLFEHMMFQGSDNIAKTEHSKFIESVGGALNASTHADFTNYFEKAPSNQLELCLWLESDRMRSLKVTADNFQNQLETVKEEKRMRYDNQPYAPAHIKMEEMSFDNWSNGHPVIGYFEDLEGSSVKDVRQFFDTFYTPNNATMAIVGDINSEETTKLVNKYFATIPRGATAPRRDLTEPKQTKPKYKEIEDPLAKMPAFFMSWKAPGRREKDFYAMNLLQTILSTGESSRLYQRMVKGDKVALAVEVSYEERRGPSSFETTVVYKPGSTPDKVREILLAELDKVKTDSVSQEELQKAKNQLLRGLFSSGSGTSLQKSLSRAEMLAEYTSFFKDPSLIDTDIEKYMSVTTGDIKELANRIFTKEGVTTVDVTPKAEKKG